MIIAMVDKKHVGAKIAQLHKQFLSKIAHVYVKLNGTNTFYAYLVSFWNGF